MRGWALGGLPAALWVERHEPAVAAATRWYLATWEWLAFRLAGVAVRAAHPRPARPGPGGRRRRRRPGRKLPPLGADRRGGREPDPGRGGCARASAPACRSIGGTVDAFASYHGAGLLEPGDAFDPGGSAGGFGVYWDQPVEVAGAFVTPAPLAGRFSVGAAMAATGRALDWYRDAFLGGTVTTESLLAEAADDRRPAPTASSSCRTSPGERSPLWDPTARGVFAGLTLGPRPRPRRAGDPRGVGARDPPRRRADARRRRSGDRDARLRRPGPERRLERDQGRRHRLHGRGAAVLETAVVGSAILGAVGIGAYPDVEAAISAMTRIDHRIEPDRGELAPTYDAPLRGVRGAVPRDRADPAAALVASSGDRAPASTSR